MSRPGEVVLGFFVRAPRPGQVKTRLALPGERAAALYAAFVQDMAERLAGLQEVRLVAAVSPADAADEISSLLPAGRFELVGQAGGSLGERMAAFFGEAFAAGAARVAVVGSDAPTLPAAYIGRGLAALADHGVVLGPAADGGYYYIGLAGPCPRLFEGISWGSPRVLAQTLERAPEGVCLLPPWYDVDVPEDLERLRRDRRLAEAAPRTWRILQADSDR